MGSSVKKVVRKAGNVFSGTGLGGTLKKGSSKLMSTVSEQVSDVTGLDDKWANIVTAAMVSAVGGVAGSTLGGIGADAFVGEAAVGATTGTMAGAQASMSGVKETAKEQAKEAEQSQAEAEQKAKKIKDDKAIKIKREELAKQSSAGRRGRNRTYLGSQGTISTKARLGE